MEERGRVTSENWTSKHTKVLVLIEKGLTYDEIAEKTALSSRTILRYVGSPYFQERLKSLKDRTRVVVEQKVAESEAKESLVDKARQHLEQKALIAAKKMTAAIGRSKKPLTAVQLRICQDILDRVGLKPKEVIETHERVLAPEELSSAAETVRELEAITERLSNHINPHVLPNTSDYGSAETDERSPEPTAEGPVEETGPVGQEISSA